MPPLDAISDQTYAAAGADFAFVLTRRGRLLSRHAPLEMPQEGRSRIVEASLARIAARDADIAIVTDDNPRSEDPSSIRAAILAAAPGAREIGDRALAIRTAVAELHPGDALLIAGKGHEPGQIVGATVLPFSDHEVARAAIAERQGR